MSLGALTAGLEIARIGLDLLMGKREDKETAAFEIASHALLLVPIEDLRAHLDDFDRRAIDTAADVAEEAKLKKENES